MVAFCARESCYGFYFACTCVDCLAAYSEFRSNRTIRNRPTAALEVIDQAQTPTEKAEAHMQRGILLLHEGSAKNKEDAFAEADKEFKAVEARDATYASAYYADGPAVGHLKQDEAAKAQFQKFVRVEQKAA